MTGKPVEASGKEEKQAEGKSEAEEPRIGLEKRREKLEEHFESPGEKSKEIIGAPSTAGAKLRRLRTHLAWNRRGPLVRRRLLLDPSLVGVRVRTQGS
eukprot:scaffold1411_cov252-Pinguiococcus_pyrenoidosus.AAC.3